MESVALDFEYFVLMHFSRLSRAPAYKYYADITRHVRSIAWWSSLKASMGIAKHMNGCMFFALGDDVV